MSPITGTYSNGYLRLERKIPLRGGASTTQNWLVKTSWKMKVIFLQGKLINLKGLVGGFIFMYTIQESEIKKQTEETNDEPTDFLKSLLYKLLIFYITIYTVNQLKNFLKHNFSEPLDLKIILMQWVFRWDRYKTVFE